MDHVSFAERQAAYWLGELKAKVPPNTKRWNASRKLTLLNAIDAGAISMDAARATYRITEDELAGWRAGRLKVRDARAVA